ncbi:hypothetical protein P5663_02995 [Priestia flexa]|uniref:hypothetical protein n=1 Tax=Priestia flexa TaxID=86664 RepID=UPI00240DBB96|nr:hypothetical protein [Priestia flexa]WEZ08874.1 hypothetical protein P5663_02995 [Priestia flexa]
MSNSCVCEFLNEVSVYSVQHLGWVTAVVAAILALTSIVFSQFNERSIQSANDLARQIKNKLNQKEEYENKIQEVVEDFNMMVYLLLNTQIYKRTLNLFKYLSYFIIFLWWLSLIGYMNNAETFGDKVVIFLSTILLTIPFLFLPDILESFNKNKPIIISDKNKLDVLELVRFFSRNTPLEKQYIIKKIINPVVKVNINKNKLIIKTIFNIDVVGFNMILKVKDDNNQVTINIDKNESNIENTYSISHDVETLEVGLFKQLKSMIGKDVQIFFCFSSTEYICYKGLLKLSDGELEITFDNKNIRTLDHSDLKKKNSFMIQPVLGDAKIFDLIKEPKNKGNE